MSDGLIELRFVRNNGWKYSVVAWRGLICMPFTPTHVDKDEERRWVTREIDDLPEDAVDEAHPHVLDDSIDHPVAQAAHLGGLEPERVRRWTLSGVRHRLRSAL